MGCLQFVFSLFRPRHVRLFVCLEPSGAGFGCCWIPYPAAPVPGIKSCDPAVPVPGMLCLRYHGEPAPLVPVVMCLLIEWYWSHELVQPVRGEVRGAPVGSSLV